MKIDVVYTWVDGADPAWADKRREAAKKLGLDTSGNANSDSRFMDNQELKYSLRSIEKYAPWVNRIFILTDNQVPSWLNISHQKIQIVDHREVFQDTSVLPIFNAAAISLCLHRINNLSEHFIYFNDDVFLGSYMSPTNFFSRKGQPKIFVSTLFPDRQARSFDLSQYPSNQQTEHQSAIIKCRTLIRDKYGKEVFYSFRHGVKPMLRSAMFELENVFADSFRVTMKNKFRSFDNIIGHTLFGFYAISQSLCKVKYVRVINKKKKEMDILYRVFARYTFFYSSLLGADLKGKLDYLRDRAPMFFCLNQAKNSTEEHLRITSDFLKKYFPEKSTFEK